MPTALDISINLTGASITQAQEKTWFTAMRDALAQMGDPMARYGVIQDLGFALSVSGNALTIALKTRALADADANSPVSVPFRNVTPATGDFSVLNVTAASSLVVSSGSTLGTRANIPFRLWLVAFNDAGTWRLGVINCVTTVAGAGSGSDVQAIYALSGWSIASSVAEGGAGAADSAQTFYTGAAVTAKPVMVLGYATWESGLATPGTWSAGPTRIQPFGPGVPLPGQVIQIQRVDTGAVATGTNTNIIPADDTIPQSNEGDQYMSQAITPSSAANPLEISSSWMGASGVASASNMVSSLYQDANANALASIYVPSTGQNQVVIIQQNKIILSGTAAATTIKQRAGSAAAGTVTFNGNNGTRVFGGAMGSYLQVQELMG